MTKIIVLNKDEVNPRPDLIGQWLDESNYHTLIEEDTDVYLPPSCSDDLFTDSSCQKNCSSCHKGLDENNIIFKFRKNFFTQEEMDAAYAGLREVAITTDNRGVAAGPTTGKCGGREWVTDEQLELLEFFAYENCVSVFGDYDPVGEVNKIRTKYKNAEKGTSRGLVWLTSKVKETGFDFDTFINDCCTVSIDQAKENAKDILENFLRNTTYGNPVKSGVSGSYPRYPRFPYGRLTSYTRDNPEKFKLAYPFLQSLSKGYQNLLPDRFEYQNEFAEGIDENFRVPGTPFTTITVNRNFRTAAHYDPENLPGGMANLCVMSNNGNYDGCYLVFPEIGYAVNIRPRDLLLVQNQCGLHGNTPLVLHDDGAERVSIIAYTHESMAELGSYEYECTRRDFVESRRTNPDHPEQRLRWNGISQGMFCDKASDEPQRAREWYDWLKSKGDQGEMWLNKYHPWLKRAFESNGIEDFF